MYAPPGGRRPVATRGFDPSSIYSQAPVTADEGRERVLDLVSQREVIGATGKGTVAVTQMKNVFQMFEPDEENTISADNIIAFLRKRLNYRPDPVVVSTLFSTLMRRLQNTKTNSQASGAAGGVSSGSGSIGGVGSSSSSRPDRVRRRDSVTDDMNDSEMHLNSFIQLLREASNSTVSSYSDHNVSLDPELDELLRSLELIALTASEKEKPEEANSSASSNVNDDSLSLASQAALSGLVPVKLLKHRMRVARSCTSLGADGLSDGEMQQLIESIGIVDASGRPLEPNFHNMDEGYIHCKKFVHMLATNKPTGDR